MVKERLEHLTAGEREQLDGIMEKARKRKEESDGVLEQQMQLLLCQLKNAAAATGCTESDIAEKLRCMTCGGYPCMLCDEKLPF